MEETMAERLYARVMHLEGSTQHLVGISSTELPFTPNPKEVLFVQPDVSSPLDAFLLRRGKEVARMFDKRGYTLVYVPHLVQEMGYDYLKYNRPDYDFSPVPCVDARMVKERFYDRIFDCVLTHLDRVPQLLRYKRVLSEVSERRDASRSGRTAQYVFSHVSAPESGSDEDYFQFFEEYIESLGEERVFFALAKPKTPEDSADHYFDSSTLRLAEEIRERVEKLRQFGVKEMVIRSLFELPESRLSRLHITADYRIFLSDYDNREVKMAVLPKVLYFFYLNHPEGVPFKHLVDHRDELKRYYHMLSNRFDLLKMGRSLDALVDSTGNSVNEKCSLIRSAFLAEFDEHVARHYIVTSDPDHNKRITLDRALVQWDVPIVNGG